MSNKETQITKDAAKKQITVIREFDAPVAQVWDAWTKKELLDEWWAPKPWKANTKSMDFKEGGVWLYAMQGPEGEKQWCRVDFKHIIPQKMYEGSDAFCDEAGNVTPQPPGMDWEVEFSAKGEGTLVKTVITFATEKDMEDIINMGFEQGFTAAHGNLDQLLETKKA